jgi:hypothetical protein
MLISYKAHNGWVKQVKWVNHLECVVSCCADSRKSVCMGWFVKKDAHIRM